MKKYILSIVVLVLISISTSLAQQAAPTYIDDQTSYRNTHIGFEYLNLKLGNFESGSNDNSSAIAAGIRIDTELRKLKITPRLYFENSYLSLLKNKEGAAANPGEKTKYFFAGYSNFEIGCGYNLLRYSYKSTKRITLNKHYNGLANMIAKSENAFPITYRQVLRPRVGFNLQRMREFNNIKILQIGAEITRNFYAEVNSARGPYVRSNWLVLYYDVLLGLGNNGPYGDSTFMPNAISTYYRFTNAELRKTGWRIGMANRGDVQGSGLIWRIEVGHLPGFSKYTLGHNNSALYMMLTVGHGWSKKIKFIDKYNTH